MNDNTLSGEKKPIKVLTRREIIANLLGLRKAEETLEDTKPEEEE